uniref:RNase H type-1 domain-containing protein n=2 Tax=Glycine subgen. Soja TaxID=1462606 RepID=A0A0R0L3T8_SOYBN
MNTQNVAIELDCKQLVDALCHTSLNYFKLGSIVTIYKTLLSICQIVMVYFIRRQTNQVIFVLAFKFHTI